jgi:hypothetical protein
LCERGLQILTTHASPSRTQYTLNPKDYGAFLKLTQEKIALRTAHSKLAGYWTAELGGLNQVVHMWEYGTRSPVASLRRPSHPHTPFADHRELR